jgi:hypothetical protein
VGVSTRRIDSLLATGEVKIAKTKGSLSRNGCHVSLYLRSTTYSRDQPPREGYEFLLDEMWHNVRFALVAERTGSFALGTVPPLEMAPAFLGVKWWPKRDVIACVGTVESSLNLPGNWVGRPGLYG